jgi:hypothetical protein
MDTSSCMRKPAICIQGNPNLRALIGSCPSILSRVCLSILSRVCPGILSRVCPSIQGNYFVVGSPRKDSVPGTAFFDSMDCLLRTSYSRNLDCPVDLESVSDVISCADLIDPICAAVEVKIVGYWRLIYLATLVPPHSNQSTSESIAVDQIVAIAFAREGPEAVAEYWRR